MAECTWHQGSLDLDAKCENSLLEGAPMALVWASASGLEVSEALCAGMPQTV